MSKEERYVELKLKGCIDSKELLAEEYRIEPSDIKKTIYKIICEKEQFSADEYKLFKKSYDPLIRQTKKAFTKDRADGFESLKRFYEWYKTYDEIGTCCYCGVHQDDANSSDIFKDSKRGRGRVFEVERVVTVPENKNLYTVENCRLACHICNNAKSDFLNVSDFLPIAKGINKFWAEKLQKTIEFPSEVYTTFSE